jgi:hydroxymethylbilane synthase
MKFVVGTRGSILARTQTERFIEEFRKVKLEAEFELKVIKTLGDSEGAKPLFAIDSTGIFQKEIDQALIDNEIDFGVSSLKDVPTIEVAQTIIAAIPKRASPHDVLISKNNTPLMQLRKGAVIGTGSLRRLAQIKHLRPDIEVIPIRGNVDTRIRKIQQGEFDGIILAEAGLQRMDLTDQITERFPLNLCPSAPGQGALAIVTRKNDYDVINFLKIIDHVQSRAEVTAERTLMFELGGGCRVPIGAVGQATNDMLSLLGVMFTLDGQSRIEATAEGTLNEAEKIGKKVAEKLTEQGAKQIQEQWREKYGTW